MEHLLIYAVHALLALDNRWLRPLDKCVPNYHEVLQDPHAYLREQEIEIGPWRRPVRRFVLPILLALLGIVVILVARSPIVTVIASVAWFVLATMLVASGRGGRCVLQAQGVEFRFAGVTVFCPWEVFDGNAVLYQEDKRIDLPTIRALLPLIEVHEGDSTRNGPDVRTKHVQVTSQGELRLQHVYEMTPQDFGHFLLTMARLLADDIVLDRPPDAPPTVGKDGSMVIGLTRLRFPPQCCDCGGPPDGWQQLVAHRSMFSSDWNVSGASFVNVVAPVCLACQTANRGRYWRILLVAMVVIVVTASVAGVVLGALFELLRLTPAPGAMLAILGCSGPILGLAFSYFLANMYATSKAYPLAVSDYRPTDGTVRLKFRTPEATARFLVNWAGR